MVATKVRTQLCADAPKESETHDWHDYDCDGVYDQQICRTCGKERRVLCQYDCVATV